MTSTVSLGRLLGTLHEPATTSVDPGAISRNWQRPLTRRHDAASEPDSVSSSQRCGQVQVELDLGGRRLAPRLLTATRNTGHLTGDRLVDGLELDTDIDRRQSDIDRARGGDRPTGRLALE